MVACVQVPVRKFRERLPTVCGLLKLFLLLLSVCLSVHRALSLELHQSPIDFDPDAVCAHYMHLHGMYILLYLENACFFFRRAACFCF